MQQKFGFSKGMRQSISPNKAEPESYYEAMNKRVVVDNKSGTLALTDEPGNKLLVTIPNTLPIYTIKKVDSSATPVTTVLTFTTEWGSDIITYTTFSSIKSIYKQIQDSGFITSNVNAGFMYHSLERDTITIAFLDGTFGSLTSTSEVSIATTLIVPALQDLEIINTSFIRDNLVIFTRKGVYGQIWKGKYDTNGEMILRVSKSLVYNNKLYPIANAKYNIYDIVGRWDNEDLIKIYWSDSVNPLNHLNISSRDSLTLPLSLLSITPNVKFTIPAPTRFEYGGLYYAGMVQYGYQLYNIDGAETVISPLSGLIHLTDSNDHSGGDIGYKGLENGEVAGKAVKVEINSIDVNFEMIKVIAVYYTSEEGEPEVNVVFEGRVPSTRNISIVDAGDTVLSVYTSGQLNSIGSRLFSPKLLTSKDGYLVAGNYEDVYFDIDKELSQPWDARAYRFNNSSPPTALIRYEGSSTNYVIDSAFKISGEDVQYDHDCHLPKDLQKSSHKYSKTGAIMGGSGPNVEYEFFTRPLLLDDLTSDLLAESPTDSNRQQWGDPTNIDYINRAFVSNTSYSNYASPINQSEILGFQRDEVYRFGIVFFDNKGRESFVKWIADIKMPSAEEVDYNTTYYANQSGSLSNGRNTYDPYFKCTGGTGLYANALGVKFTINTSLLDSSWSYSIVRVRREDVDKTILAQGVLFNANWSSQEELGQPAPIHGMNISTYYDEDEVNKKVRGLTFLYSPELNFKKSFNKLPGDLIRFKNTFTPSSYTIPAGQGGENSVIFKVGTLSSGLNVGTKTIEDSLYVNPDRYLVHSISTASDYLRFQNYLNTTGSGDSKAICYAGSSLAIGFTDKTALPSGVKDIAIVNYERLTNIQYGGANYNVKLNNQYIRSGKVYPCNGMSLPAHVFGGDTFIGIYNYLPTLKDRESNYDDNNLLPLKAMKEKTILYVPLETSINLSLRHGTHPGNNYIVAREPKLQETVQKGFEVWPEGNDDGAYPSYLTDIYQYNFVYSKQNTGKTFKGKPLNFKNTVLNDCIATNSEKNIPGESVDSWTRFLFNNKIRVESVNGPLTKLHVFRNQLMFWQNKAFGIFGFNDRRLLKEPNGAELILGTGSILEYYRYFSEKSGTSFTRSIVDSGAAMYWFDDLSKKMMMFAGEHEQSISDVSGVAPLFLKPEIDKPLDIIGVFDKSTRRVLHSFIKQEDIYIPPPPDPEFVDIELLVNPNIEQIKYGALYNWYAATDARNIANTGWHVPTNSEFNTLIAYLGDSSVVGGYLKEIGTNRWSSPNTGATNTSGFTGVGGGLRFDSYVFFLLGESGYYWSSTSYDTTLAYGMQLGNITTLAFIFSGDGTKSAGMSLRLIKDSTTLTHGQTGTYTGNDGKVYRTICIGTQEWLADNLCETKYRDGDWITGFDGGVYTPISDVDWAAKTTEAMCFYEDLVTNAIEVLIGGTVTGAGTYLTGQTIQIVATPNAGWQFVNWTDVNGVVSTSPTFDFIATADRAITANFEEVIVPVPQGLELTFDSIANVPVANASSVSDWNTFFDLPTNGTPFTSVEVDGAKVTLGGGANIHLKNKLFYSNTHLIGFNDTGCVISADDACFAGCSELYNVSSKALGIAGFGCFQDCLNLVIVSFPALETAGAYSFKSCNLLINPSFPSLQSGGDYFFTGCGGLNSPSFPSLQTVGNGFFLNCIGLTSPYLPMLQSAGSMAFTGCASIKTIYLPVFESAGNYCFSNCVELISLSMPILQNLGTTTKNNQVFANISGKSITLTVPSSLMTCNGGQPDGDIQYLDANNNLTIIQV